MAPSSGHCLAAQTIARFLARQALPFDPRDIPATAALVGGTVRDALLGRDRSKLDLDFVVPSGAIGLGRRLAQKYGAGFVVLDRDRDIARLVFQVPGKGASGKGSRGKPASDRTAPDRANSASLANQAKTPATCTVDLAAQVGPDLVTDLGRRDFAANAIAFRWGDRDQGFDLDSQDPDLVRLGQRLVDPFDGCGDLARRQLRMVAPENFEDDPLRLLRAYRLAATLDLDLEPATRQAIVDRADQLRQVAAERVQAELYALLGAATGDRWLAALQADGLHEYWLPDLGPEGLAAIDRLTEAGQSLAPVWPDLADRLQREIAPNRPLTGLGLARLALAVGPDLATAQATLWQLKAARADQRSVAAILRSIAGLKATQPLRTPGQPATETLGIPDQFDLFKAAGQDFPAAAIAAVAAGVPSEWLREPIARWHRPDDPVARPQSLVTGDRLATALGLKPSPAIGQLLLRLELAYAQGQITTTDEAIALAEHLVCQQPEPG